MNEATEPKLIQCLEIVNNRLKLKINDNYMYQVQGQLNISKNLKSKIQIFEGTLKFQGSDHVAR
jgi:hypothetical protein